MSRMRDEDFPKITYLNNDRKPSEFERWNQATTVKVSSIHPEISAHWGLVQAVASTAYD